MHTSCIYLERLSFYLYMQPKIISKYIALMSSKRQRHIENSKLCFCDMKIMSRRNGGDSVNNESAGRVVYQVTTIPE